MFSTSGFFATSARRTVVAFVILGLMIPPVAPAFAQEAKSAKTSPTDTSEPGAVVERDREGSTVKNPPITLKLPEQAQPDQETPPGLDRNDGETPSDDGGFGMLSGGSFFPLDYGRLSHASVPRLGPS